MELQTPKKYIATTFPVHVKKVMTFIDREELTRSVKFRDKMKLFNDLFAAFICTFMTPLKITVLHKGEYSLNSSNCQYIFVIIYFACTIIIEKIIFNRGI